MRKEIIFIFLVCICGSCFGQSIDTVDFWNGSKLVTDLSLNDEGNCFKVDTGIRWHACDHYFGEEVKLFFYPKNEELCDSIRSLKSDKERNLAFVNNRLRKELDGVKEIRLLQDRPLGPEFYFSPEILFQVEINRI